MRPQTQDSNDTMQITAPAEAAALIDQLRDQDHSLTITYHPDMQTIRTNGRDPVAITVGRDR